MNKKPIKVAVTGAAGQIGYALLFRIASGQMFGLDQPVILHLLELEKSLPVLHGTAMELNDCAFPLLKNIVCTSQLNESMKDINWAILVGSMPRKEGMERADLLKINGSIFAPQGKAINDHAAADAKVFVVGNPCNTNCLIAMHHAPDIPKEDRFFAMTLLDENRARAQLAKKAEVSVEEVTQMAIWGNHSSTQYPDFYNAKIANKRAVEVITDKNWLENDFIPIVQKRGAAVIKARGASSAASAANAIVGSIYHLTHDTKKDDFFSVAACSMGQYGVDEGLIFSFPSRVDNGQFSTVNGIQHNSFGQEKIKLTLNELRAEKDEIKEMGLI